MQEEEQEEEADGSRNILQIKQLCVQVAYGRLTLVRR